MKRVTLLVASFLISIVSMAQGEIGRHFVLGYGLGSTNISNAYSGFYHKDATLPMDLTTMDFHKDKFNHTSWMLRSSYWDENIYIDSELSYFMSLLTGLIGSGIKGEKFNPGNLAGAGKLKKLGENTSQDAIGYGMQAPIIMVDIAVGADYWYLGGIWGFSSWGLDELSGTSTGRPQGSRIYINEERNTLRHLGLSIKRGLDTRFGPSILSLEVNHLKMKYKNAEDVKRNGIESRLSYKAYTDGYKGLYAELFYRIQRFKKFERPANWVRNSNGENGFVPGITMSGFGLNVGFYFDY